MKQVQLPVQPEDLDLPHSRARSIQPAPLVVAAQGTRTSIEPRLAENEASAMAIKNTLVDPGDSPLEICCIPRFAIAWKKNSATYPNHTGQR